MPAWWDSPTATHAFVLSWVSVIVTLAAAIGGIVGAMKTENSLLLSYGLENVVDFFSSVVVLWRFFAPKGINTLQLAKLARREKRASVAISFILFVLGVGIIIAAINDYKKGLDQDAHVPILIGISFASIPIFGLLTIVKFHFATKLNSRALQKDGYCSLIGTALSTSLFFNTLIVSGTPKAWWLDPTIALIVGCVSFFIGLRALLISSFEKGVPIWSPTWWFYSAGADVSATTPVDGGKSVDERTGAEEGEEAEGGQMA
mmetsp:Transcript_43543/g.52783  ORF Transcript_43543/g.52783 Transcript_43543/m.52783 type:complete len:260 (+) Transcript_43543:200-979(+)|eukprot:CAMPEP_0172484936 /NCGR_PEP_ID=MMETSP1066-20121228/12626_1 /TAXON_ID=671091 /ORGANISM="Coscinodiscus wailesii, Strain CCMP2513" /LENGTH=259 /DNA_ID=CAMNT_0013249785 /DNA_START=71 /DNA_END=850 /DNA_ORIENTATION=-